MSTKSNANATKDAAKATSEIFDAVAAAGKGNVEAAVAAGTVAAKGFEAIGSEVMALTKTCVEDGIAATNAVMGAKTYKEVVDLQAEYAQASLQSFLAAGTRLGEMSVKMTNDVLEPVNVRFTSAVEKFASPGSL